MRTKTRKPRCRQVLVILNNKLETVRLLREKVYPPIGDFASGPLEVAVVEYQGLEVEVPMFSVVFLRDET